MLGDRRATQPALPMAVKEIMTRGEKATPSLHSLRDVSPSPFKGASPVTGGNPVTAIAGLACFAAARLVGFRLPRVARSAMDH